VSLVAACDFVLAGEKSAWSMAYTNLGATPDGGATWFLPRLMGARRARELILLSERFDGPTALRLDLVNRLLPDTELHAEARALAERLAAGPTRAYANARRLLAQSFDNALDVQLEREAESFAQCADTQDFAEGVAAFTGRRRPDFSGR
jgi:2-(1,2-epoxy-1,2-dihydrophenyl)acetyl-CoA isomerase